MTRLGYPLKTDPKKTARATGRNVRISRKNLVEIGRFIKGMKTEKAKKILEEVISLKRAIPFRRFNTHLAHKKGIGPGRYPVKSSRWMLELIKSVESNSENIGLDVNKLYIKNVSARKGSDFQRPRRADLRGQKAKSTNISLIVEER